MADDLGTLWISYHLSPTVADIVNVLAETLPPQSLVNTLYQHREQLDTREGRLAVMAWARAMNIGDPI
jgi:hypothetical protein